MPAKWRVLTDVSEIKRMVRAGLAYWNPAANIGRPYELASGVWEEEDNAELATSTDILYVLEENDEE